MQLILAFQSDPIKWKFYFHPGGGYERPDKIVFYPSSRRQLIRLIRKLRALLEGCAFHPLAHAASTADLGLEPPESSGLFVGSDPCFLSLSWRAYRAICFAWLELNQAYIDQLKGGRRGWLRKMNFSEEHEGPRSLQPDHHHQKYVKEYWRRILPQQSGRRRVPVDNRIPR